jgi:hypothetical protein
MIARDMGELQSSGHIANGIDTAVGTAQIGTHLDATAVVLDSGLVQTQSFDIGKAANGNQHVGAIDKPSPASLS